MYSWMSLVCFSGRPCLKSMLRTAPAEYVIRSGACCVTYATPLFTASALLGNFACRSASVTSAVLAPGIPPMDAFWGTDPQLPSGCCWPTR
ncbi:MAG: hypothetical protein AMS16_04400 [Planctomycetes bacterium DG_58]|nr:MAG: hypothetical protein AMS16_04400 [Planctomycetes bacterium DG_58]